jgi:hypothetical protein
MWREFINSTRIIESYVSRGEPSKRKGSVVNIVKCLFFGLCILLISLRAMAIDFGVITLEGQGAEPVQITMEQIQAMPATEFESYTPWTEGKTHFKGIRLQTLMEHLGVTGDVIRVKALNQYHADIAWKELAEYPVIFAYEMDGEPMSIREKGPYWLMFPMTDYPELNVPKYHISMVWQVAAIEVL